MSAGMHGSHFLAIVGGGDLGSKGHRRSFPQGKAVHIRPQAYNRPGLRAAQDAYHACLAHTFFYFQPQRPEVVCNDLSRPEFMIAQFRVFMEISSPGDGFWFDLICCRTNEGSEIIFLSCDVQRRQEKAKRKKKGSSHVG